MAIEERYSKGDGWLGCHGRPAHCDRDLPSSVPRAIAVLVDIFQASRSFEPIRVFWKGVFDEVDR